MPKGEWPPRSYPVGKNIPVGRISASLTKAFAPGEHTLIVTVGPADLFDPLTGKIRPDPKAKKGINYFENHWSFLVYPEMVPDEFRRTVRTVLFRAHATSSSRVHGMKLRKNSLAAAGFYLCLDRADLDWTSPPLDRVPVFWNRQMGPAWGRMLGLSVDWKSGGRSLRLQFPTQSYFDWRWGPLISNVRAINLDQYATDVSAGSLGHRRLES